jgi:hypothetical protein
MKKTNILKKLPVEIIHHVFEYFDIQDLGHASRVSHLWHQLSKLDLLWKSNSKKYFHGDEGLYDQYKSFAQHQSRLQLFAVPISTNIVYMFDPFSKFCVRGTSLTESMQEFWNVMSFLGVQHDEHDGEKLIEARPRIGERASTMVREGVFVDALEQLLEVYLIYYCDYVGGKVLDFPISCFCPSLQIIIDYDGKIPAGDVYTQQAAVEKQMAAKMQAILSAHMGSFVKFVMWDKGSIMCTKMHRIIDTTNNEEENDEGKSKRLQYWFGGFSSEQQDETPNENAHKPLFVFAQ